MIILAICSDHKTLILLWITQVLLLQHIH